MGKTRWILPFPQAVPGLGQCSYASLGTVTDVPKPCVLSQRNAARDERRPPERKMAWNVNSHLLTPHLYKKCAVPQANLIFSDATQSSARQSSGWRVQLLSADPTMKDSSFPGLSGWDFADYRSLISPAATSLCRMQRERCG